MSDEMKTREAVYREALEEILAGVHDDGCDRQCNGRCDGLIAARALAAPVPGQPDRVALAAAMGASTDVRLAAPAAQPAAPVADDDWLELDRYPLVHPACGKIPCACPRRAAAPVERDEAAPVLVMCKAPGMGSHCHEAQFGRQDCVAASRCRYEASAPAPSPAPGGAALAEVARQVLPKPAPKAPPASTPGDAVGDELRDAIARLAPIPAPRLHTDACVNQPWDGRGEGTGLCTCGQRCDKCGGKFPGGCSCPEATRTAPGAGTGRVDCPCPRPASRVERCALASNLTGPCTCPCHTSAAAGTAGEREP